MLEQALSYLWEDCSIGFTCPLCGEPCVADSQNEELECPGGCGLRYVLAVDLKVRRPAEPEPPTP